MVFSATDGLIILHYFTASVRVWHQQLEDAVEKLQQATVKQTTVFHAQAFQFENADWELWAPGGR